MQDSHLRPVNDQAPTEQTDAPAPQPTPTGVPPRKQTRPRAKRALPTDRMKLSVQKDALGAIAVASHYGEQAVGADAIARRIGVADTTAGLNNAFFVECGLIVKEGKGRYKSTEAANDFARAYSFEKDTAGAKLASALRQTWFFETVQQQIAGMGPTTVDTMIQILAGEAGASNDHRIQLQSTLSWLEYAGLIELTEDDKVVLSGASESDTADREDDPTDSSDKADEKLARDAKSVEKTDDSQSDERQRRKEPLADTVLGFSFDFALTKDDLAKLNPDQIQAVFEAVGKVMAIKATK
jgi:hypothetical protein